MHQSTVFLSPFLFLLLIMNVFGATSVSFDNTSRINAAPLSVSISASPNPVNVGQPVSLVCIGTGGIPPYVYFWALGDGSTGAGSSRSHSYNAPGAMTVVCTVTDNTGATGIGQSVVTVT